jgi:hypothetical protein
MRDEIYSKRWTVTVGLSGGIAIDTLLGNYNNNINGYIEQINVRASSGGGGSADVQIRGDQTSSDIENLFYSNSSAALPLTDSAINAPFDTRGTEDGAISLYINPAASGVFEIRIDFRILGKNS